LIEHVEAGQGDKMAQALSTRGIFAAVAAVTALTVPMAAIAQDAAEKPKDAPKETGKSKPADATSDTVTITSKKTDAAGKEVYDVTKNADANTGTATDALNKVPGVNVDNDGNVSVRGQAAKVLLNGRPSLMFSGDNRGVALRSMPSAYISSIEVISNPGSQYSSDSSGPIVNIVTKRNMPPGMFGNVTAQAASNGGGMAFAFVSFNKDKLTITGSASYIDNDFDIAYRGTTQAFDTAGNMTRSSLISGRSDSRYSGPSLMAQAQYDLDDNDVLTGSLNVRQGRSENASLSESSQLGVGGTATDLFAATGDGIYDNGSATASFGYVHYGEKPDQSLKLDVSLSSNTSENVSRNASTYTLSSVPANAGTRYDRKEGDTETQNLILQADYNTTFGRVQVSTGAQLSFEDNRAVNVSYGPGASADALSLQSLLSSDFRYSQTVSAVYGTVQKEFGPRWTVLAGVRAEALELETEEAQNAGAAQIDYVRLNPSLFATYTLSKEKKLRFSYTHKQQRPAASDLNPGLIYRSLNSVTIGNEDLKPQESDNIEVSYEVTGKTGNYAVRGFYRYDDDTIVSSSRIIPDPLNLGNLVTETSRLNFGHQTNSGVTLGWSRRWDKKLNINVDLTVTAVELLSPHFAEPQTATVPSGSISANYTFKDTSQLSLNYRLIGQRFTGQGYSESYAQGAVNYRRNLTKTLALTVTVQDPLRTTRTVTVTDTPQIQSRFITDRNAPTVMIGLSRSIGGPKMPAK
jgi:outer membrane receptor protein involved in Fe transport